jgi:excisionase family DNA binding protein
MDGPLLLSPREAAKALGMGRSRLYELLRAGDIKSLKVGRLRKIARADLDAFVEGLRAASQ